VVPLARRECAILPREADVVGLAADERVLGDTTVCCCLCALCGLDSRSSDGYAYCRADVCALTTAVADSDDVPDAATVANPSRDDDD
jgi:hypothetical protein